MNNLRELTREKLIQRYPQLVSEEHIIPEKKTKSNWKVSNKLGFFLGIIKVGLEEHVKELYGLLNNEDRNIFDNEMIVTANSDDSTPFTFIDRLFNFYIATFHKRHSDTESCRMSRQSSSESIAKEPQQAQQTVTVKEPKHSHLVEGVTNRDVVCLFCWDTISLEGAHIVAQKINPLIAIDVNSVLFRCGLQFIHQTENGMLLCNKCHDQFDYLKRYVDEVNGKLVVKIVNETNDTTSEKHRQWEKLVKKLINSRIDELEDWKDGRQVVNGDGEIQLYFVNNNAAIQPNRKGLEFHKAACIIWRMAGGAEPVEDDCCDDDEEIGVVDTAALKRRFNIKDSADTLFPIS